VEHDTTLLFGLAGVVVARVEPATGGGRVVEVVTADAAAACCPDCGIPSSSVKQNVVSWPKDLPFGEAPLHVVWHKRRWRFGSPAVRGSRSPSGSPSCPLGLALRAGCGGRWRTRWRLVGRWPRSPRRIG
jgi:transposase